jgi:pimeloyl-ACP methyl ester carboxylesterase
MARICHTFVRCLAIASVAFGAALAGHAETPASASLAPRAEVPAAVALAPADLSPPVVGPPVVAASPSVDAAFESVSTDAAADKRPYRKRQWVRQTIVSERDLAKYRLDLDADFQKADAEKPTAILIHGFNSTPVRNAGLFESLRAAQFPCGTFAYPNDYTLPSSAELLSTQLHQFAAEHPQRKLALVCHSTGGLVARACVENPALDPGNVDRLIMIAPPNHGSQLARFACGTDVWEHWLSRKKGWPWTRVHDSIVDGLGEAADELRPDSEFLRELNARPRNPNVRYTILLGTRACATDAELAWVRENICERLMKVPGVDGKAERLDALLADIDEIVEGKGDGVVAVKRGRLAGVDDTVVLPFCHMTVGGEPGDRELAAVYQVVLSRLQTR